MKHITAFLTTFFTLYISLSQAQNLALDSITNIHQITKTAEKGPWKTVKDESGITLQYRSIKLGQSIKTRELKANFTVHANKDSAFSYLHLPQKYKIWNKGSKLYTILDGDSLNWIAHSVYNIPFPLSQQDLVTDNSRVDTNQHIIINTISNPNYIPIMEDVNRIKYYIAQWVIAPKDSNVLEITFNAITLSKSYIPRFIKDPIVQNNLIKSFAIFKQRLETH